MAAPLGKNGAKAVVAAIIGKAPMSEEAAETARAERDKATSLASDILSAITKNDARALSAALKQHWEHCLDEYERRDMDEDDEGDHPGILVNKTRHKYFPWL